MDTAISQQNAKEISTTRPHVWHLPFVDREPYFLSRILQVWVAFHAIGGGIGWRLDHLFSNEQEIGRSIFFTLAFMVFGKLAAIVYTLEYLVDAPENIWQYRVHTLMDLFTVGTAALLAMAAPFFLSSFVAQWFGVGDFSDLTWPWKTVVALTSFVAQLLLCALARQWVVFPLSTVVDEPNHNKGG